jgi:hypothetical protein
MAPAKTGAKLALFSGLLPSNFLREKAPNPITLNKNLWV